MPRPEFEGGIPRSLLTREDSREVLQTMYGQFSGSVLHSIQLKDSDAPLDIVTFGENWFQLFQSRSEPKNAQERAIQEATKNLDSRMFGPTFFGDMWQIMERQQGYTIRHLLADLQAGVQAGSLDPRILEKLAVLDLSETDPMLRESDFSGAEDTPWGENGILPGTATLIYHITSGYPRMMVEQMSGSSDDDISATFFGFGPMKWE